MNVNFLLNSRYWFNPIPTTESKLYLPLAIVFGLMLIGGMAITFFTAGDFRKVWLKYASPLITISILGFIYLFARYEELPWLASRFSLGLLLSAGGIWLSILLLWSAKYIPKMIESKEIEDKFNKYLPRKK